MQSYAPYKENMIFTGPGKYFPVPLAYKGWPLYFGSLEQVQVPLHLQASLAYELSVLFESETFAKTVLGRNETGTVSVADVEGLREFAVSLTLTDSNRDDYYLVDSIMEVK